MVFSLLRILDLSWCVFRGWGNVFYLFLKKGYFRREISFFFFVFLFIYSSMKSSVSSPIMVRSVFLSLTDCIKRSCSAMCSLSCMGLLK